MLNGLGTIELARRVARRYAADRIADQSAKLSFYSLLSIFPLLFFLTSLLGLVLRRGDRSRQMLFDILSSVIPPSAWSLIDSTLNEIAQGAGGLSLSIALLATIWTSSRGTAAVIEGLNVAYEVRQYRSWWRRNALAVVLTLGFASGTVLALALLMVGGRAMDWASGYLGAGPSFTLVWHVVEKLLAMALALLAFNVLYAFGPNVENRRWRWFMPGTLVGVALWLAVSFGFRLYLHFFDRYSTTYGSIGAVVVLMLWFYLSGIAILVGGEVNSEVEKASRGGAPAEPKE